MTVRTRFAPSPTGALHIGSVRTALYCWLYARHCGGAFILRIEDTDRERSTQESVDSILQGLDWLGLTQDEGPFYQTERMSRYEVALTQLLDSGQAYRCTCSKERLQLLREEQLRNKQKPRYDGHCRELSLIPRDEPFVIRFKNPKEGQVHFIDCVRGEIVYENSELDDLILARSDGSPTYNFTVVVDDLDMQITHVLRGDDHINNTPRQINLFKALGAEPPVYGHMPMILGSDKKKLSKRHGALDVSEYKQLGFLPEALRNYLLRLGWSHKDQEIFSEQEMIDLFDLEHISKSPAAFNADKLLWVNQHYLKSLPVEEGARLLAEQLGVGSTVLPDVADVFKAQAERVKTFEEMANQSRFFYEEFETYEEKAARKHLTTESRPILEALKARLDRLKDWKPETIHQIIIELSEQFELKMGKVAQPLRVAVCGCGVSPSVGLTVSLLGKDKTLERISRAISFI